MKNTAGSAQPSQSIFMTFFLDRQRDLFDLAERKAGAGCAHVSIYSVVCVVCADRGSELFVLFMSRGM